MGDFSILIRMQITFNVGQIALIHHIAVPRYEPLPKYDQGQKGGELYILKGMVWEHAKIRSKQN